MRAGRAVFAAAALAACVAWPATASADPGAAFGAGAGHGAFATWAGEAPGGFAQAYALGADVQGTDSVTANYADLSVVKISCENDRVVLRFYWAEPGSYDGSALDHGEMTARDFRMDRLSAPNCDVPNIDELSIDPERAADLTMTAAVTQAGLPAPSTPGSGLGVDWGAPCAWGGAGTDVWRPAEARLDLGGAEAADLGLPPWTYTYAELFAGAGAGAIAGDDSCWQDLAGDLRGDNGRRARGRAFARLAGQLSSN